MHADGKHCAASLCSVLAGDAVVMQLNKRYPNMRLFVEDKEKNERVYLKQMARTRAELAEKIGSYSLRVNNKTYSVHDVKAAPSENTAGAMALGGAIGVVGGVTGVIIGGAIGALLGKSSDDDDKQKTIQFNRS